MSMSDPSFIYLLTRDYNDMIRNSRYTESSAITEYKTLTETGENYDISGAEQILDADDLFNKINPQLESSDFYLLMVNGQQGSGKTTVGRELAHKAHQEGYKIIYTSGFDIMEAPETYVRAAGGAKKVAIILDDASYVLSAASGKMASKIKNYFTLIRHSLHAQVLIITICHFTTAVPPVFKNSNVWIFSHPTTQEFDAMTKIVGRGEHNRDNLDKMFNAVVKIQEKATERKDLTLKINNRKYGFKWGDKHDPGDGRLMLMIISGETVMYNSKNLSCPECEFIGKDIKVRTEDYKNDEPKDKESDLGEAAPSSLVYTGSGEIDTNPKNTSAGITEDNSEETEAEEEQEETQI